MCDKARGRQVQNQNQYQSSPAEVQDGDTGIVSIFTTRTIVLIKRADLHLPTPQRPRPSNCALHRLPCVVGLLLGQILQITLALCFPRLDLASRLDVNLAFQRMTEVRIMDDQGCGLRLCGFLGVDRLVYCLFDTMCQGGEAVALKQNYGVTLLSVSMLL